MKQLDLEDFLNRGRKAQEAVDEILGTAPHKLHRREAPPTSVDAAHSIDSIRLERMVYDAICQHGPEGCIATELLQQFSAFAYSSITARFSALERKGLIVCGPDKRVGASGRNQRVMRKAP